MRMKEAASSIASVWAAVRVAMLCAAAAPRVSAALPNRAVNISDDEVREIQSVMPEVAPGAIIYIGPVTRGCICEDGATCQSNVTVVLNHRGSHQRYWLSRYDDHWTVGPLLQWMLAGIPLKAKYEALRRAPRTRQWWREWEALIMAIERYQSARPRCGVTRSSAALN